MALTSPLSASSTNGLRKPCQFAGLLIEELRRRRILLPTPRVLELVIHHAASEPSGHCIGP